MSVTNEDFFHFRARIASKKVYNYWLFNYLFMSEEQQEVTPAEKTGGVAKMLLSKVVSHKIFSDSVLKWLLLSIAFLLPVFFIPGTTVAPEFAKMILLEVLILFGIFAWALGRLRDGRVTLPKSMLLGVATLLAVVFVVSALLSPAPIVSFFGSGYDIGTVNTFIVLFLLMFLSSSLFKDRNRILSLYIAFLLSGVVVILYQLLRRFFGADFLTMGGTFTTAVASPVGKWNDFASLVGALEILVVSTLYFFPQNKSIRIPAFVLFFVGLFFLLLIDFTVLWMILGVFVVGLIALSVYEGEKSHNSIAQQAEQEGREHKKKAIHKRMAGHLPLLATLLLVVSIIYGTGISTIQWGKSNATIATWVGTLLKASPYSEVVLTPKTTYEVVAGTLKDSPLFGTGPNRFASSFLVHKSSDMNRTPFWDTAFDFGLGRIPTYFGTTGIVGMLLWFVFILLLLTKARHIKRLFQKDRIAAYLAYSLFVLTLYFWALAFFYLPNIAIFALAFVFAGALIAFLSGEGVIKHYDVQFDENKRTSFIFTPILIIVLIGTVAGSYMLYRQVSSLVAYHDAQLAIAASNVDQAESSLKHANELSKRDIYLRSLSNVALLRLTRLAGENLPQAEFQAKANQLIADARVNAEDAVKLDPTNFENYLQLGGVYDTLGSLGIQGTTEPARANYLLALTLNPKSPRVLFTLARLEYLANDHPKAKDYLNRALEERPNYLEAVSFLVQLELQDKNPESAITALKKSIAAEPTNFLLHFALGYLEYAKRDYPAAISEFEGAVILNPVYADAKYFLGLSYYRVGRKDEAVQQFTDVQTLNPENKDVSKILSNIKAGRDPFETGSVAPTQPVSDALKDLNKGTPTKPAN